jgi:hypothetical protein
VEPGGFFWEGQRWVFGETFSFFLSGSVVLNDKSKRECIVYMVVEYSITGFAGTRIPFGDVAAMLGGLVTVIQRTRGIITVISKIRWLIR